MARVRRSLLFVSSSEPEALERVHGSGADTLVLDLEDTVTPDRKPLARRLVAEFLRSPSGGGVERAVRINPTTSPYFTEDVQAVIPAGADALVVPKVGSADQMRLVDERLAIAEREAARASGSVRLLPLIETAIGVLNAYPIAAASPRVEALLIGHVDLSLSLGIREAGVGEGTIFHARCQIVLAARAASREAIDAICLNLDDVDAFRAEAREGQRLGYSGKLLMHPSQVPLVHEVYTPSQAEIVYARRVVDAFEIAAAEGTGMFLLDGRMVDLPVVEAERTVLERARRAGVI